MQGALLVPVTGETKQDVAACESKRLKRLMGGLRHLYRNCSLSSLLFRLRIPLLFPGFLNLKKF